jgi:hypothetical protein
MAQSIAAAIQAPHRSAAHRKLDDLPASGKEGLADDALSPTP